MPGIRPFTGRKLTVGRVRGVYTPPTGGGGGGPAFRAASSTTTTSSTMTCAIPTGTAAGDILVLTYWYWYDAKAGSPAAVPTGWTQRAFDYSDSGDAWRYAVYTKTAGASESSITQTGTNWLAGQMNMIAISGGTAVDVVGTLSNSGGVASSVTTTTSTDLLVGTWMAIQIATARPITAPASMTSRVTTSVTNTVAFTSNVATQTLTASGATGTRTATTAGTPTIYSLLLAVK